MKLTPQAFRRAMGNFATGVTVVTTLDDNGTPYGLTVNSFTSVSLDPLLVLVCLDCQLSSLPVFLEKKQFAINILSDDQQEISHAFASKDCDRSRWLDAAGELGMPIISTALAQLECTTAQAYPAGDHVILLGQVQSIQLAKNLQNRSPLLYFRGRYRQIRPVAESEKEPLLVDKL